MHLLSPPAARPPPFFVCLFVFKESHKWHDGSTAGHLSGMLLNTGDFLAACCQSSKHPCYAADGIGIVLASTDKSQFQTGLCTYRADYFLRIIANVLLPSDGMATMYVVEKHRQFCNFSFRPTVSSESQTDPHKYLLCLLFPEALYVSLLTVINPAATFLPFKTTTKPSIGLLRSDKERGKFCMLINSTSCFSLLIPITETNFNHSILPYLQIGTGCCVFLW